MRTSDIEIRREKQRGTRVQKVDVVILGAGAAGMMCAIEAGRRGRRVVLLDHAERVGKKILISGGGRCNFTNIHCRAENFSPKIRTSQNPRWPASPRQTSSPWSRDMEFAITKRPSDNSSAIVSPGYRDHVGARVRRRQRAHHRRRANHLVVRDGHFRVKQRQTIFEAKPSSSPPAACRSRRWARQDSATAGAAVRPAHRRVQTRLGAAGVQRRRPRTMVRSCGCLSGGSRGSRSTRDAAASAKRCW